MECCWAGLVKKVEVAEDLDQVIDAHDSFLEQITTQCLLDTDSQVQCMLITITGTKINIKLSTESLCCCFFAPIIYRVVTKYLHCTWTALCIFTRQYLIQIPNIVLIAWISIFLHCSTFCQTIVLRVLWINACIHEARLLSCVIMLCVLEESADYCCFNTSL